MNFDLTNEQEALRMKVRDFAEQEIKPCLLYTSPSPRDTR